MPDNDVTLGELARRMDLLHSDVKELRASIVEHDDLSAVANSWQLLLQSHESRAELVRVSIEQRLASLEAWNTWAMRIVLGLVLAAVVGVALVDLPRP